MRSWTTTTIARCERLRPAAERLGVRMSQLALAWCLRRDNVASVIVGATSLHQLGENVKASGLTLPADLEAELDALFPRE